MILKIKHSTPKIYTFIEDEYVEEYRLTSTGSVDEGDNIPTEVCTLEPITNPQTPQNQGN